MFRRQSKRQKRLTGDEIMARGEQRRDGVGNGRLGNNVTAKEQRPTGRELGLVLLYFNNL